MVRGVGSARLGDPEVRGSEILEARSDEYLEFEVLRPGGPA